MSDDTLLKVRNLKIGARIYPPGEKPRDIEIVHGVSFDLEKGKVLGLIGESGAGKSTSAAPKSPMSRNRQRPASTRPRRSWIR